MRIAFIFVTLVFFFNTSFAASENPEIQGPPRATPPLVSGESFSRGVALPSWAQALADIPPSKHKDPVVARLFETQVSVNAPSAILLNKAIQVNDRKALGSIGQYGIEYYPAYQKLLLHRVAILRGNQVIDKTASVDIRLLQNEPNLEERAYVGAITMQLLLEDVRIGDTLWITYTIEGDNPVFGGKWADNFHWDSSVPIELRRLVVSHPRNRPLFWRQLGDYHSEKITPGIENTGETQRLHFEQVGIDALPDESGSPSDYMSARVLQFSEFPDWKSVALWADSLFPMAGTTTLQSGLVKEFAKESGKMAQASAALHWVQDEIRYFSVDIGENSHRPHAPDFVIEKRYGDCKDKSYLLVSLLQQLDIDAHPVLLSATAPKLPAKIIATHSWFNHVIVELSLDGKTFYVDPTRDDQVGSIDSMPPAYPGATAVVINAGTRNLITLPESTETDPHYEHVDKIRIAAFEADATLEAQDIYRGTYADWARSRYPDMSEEELSKDVLSEYEKLYPGVTLQGSPRVEDSVEVDEIKVVAKFNLPKPVTKEDKYYQIDYDSQVMAGTLHIPDNLTRHYPYALPRGKFRGLYRLEIEWPSEIRANNIQHAADIDNAFFTAHDEYIARGNLFSYLMQFQIKKDVVSAAELPQLHILTKTLNNWSSSSFRISDYWVTAKDDEVLSMRHLEEKRAASIFANDRRIIRKLADAPDDIDISCRTVIRARAISELLNDNELALLNSVEPSLRAKMSNPGVRACLARMAFSNGEFKESANLYQAERSLKDESPYKIDLAWARFYSNDPGGALTTMSNYIAARKKSESEHLDAYDLVSEIALLQRLGKSLSAEQKKMATEFREGPWPRPLLAQQIGALSQEKLFTTIDAYPHDARDCALTEAWFYIGQQRLATNDVKGAMQAFNWLMVNGVRSSRYYLLAKAELQRTQPADAKYQAGLEAFHAEKYADAQTYWKESANAGTVAAQFELGSMAFEGIGLQRDYAKAMHWFGLAANHGEARAMNMLGVMYAKGLNVSEDKQIALDWYQKGADLGNATAISNLGFFYLKGHAVEKNVDKAFEAFRNAAELGNVVAQYQLADMYEKGSGTKRNKQLAAFWARRGADQGDDDSQNKLGYYYEYGIGIEKDDVEAMNYYGLAAEKGHATAQYNVGRLYEELPELRDDKIASKWYAKSAEQGFARAQLRYAILLAEGRGVSQNLVTARQMMSKAAEQGGDYAKTLLAEIDAMIKSGKDIGHADGPAKPTKHLHCYLASEYDFEEDYKAALPELTNCLAYQLAPELQRYVLELRANAYEELHRYHDALDDQWKIVKLQPPQDQWPYLMLAVYQRDLKQYDDALTSIEQARAVLIRAGEKTGMPYGIHKGWTLQEMGKHQSAIETFTEAIPAQPDYFYVYFRRSISYEALGDAEHAREDMAKAFQYLGSEGQRADTVSRFKKYGYTVALKSR